MAVIRIGADNLPDPDVVELFDHKFTVRRVTRSVQKGLETVDKKLRAMGNEEDGDKIVALMAEGLDSLLAPNGKATPAKKVLADAWKADELSLDQLSSLYESVQESAAKRPPTSASAT
jgi:vacuolar-type H+-ATPase subunit E/Vma4